MASVELLKKFEEAVKAEAEARIEYDNKLDNLTKAQNTLAKVQTHLDNLKTVWDEAERIKSALFDQILAVQNL